jgi:glycine dehydrogenase subunit 1
MCYHKAHYAADQIGRIDGFQAMAETPFFNEFRVRCPAPVPDINAALVEHNILGGYDLALDYPHLENEMLVCVTEMNSREQIDRLVGALRAWQSCRR